MVSGAGPDTDAAIFAFGAAPLQVSLRVGPVGVLAGTGGGCFESHAGDASLHQLAVDCESPTQMSGFCHDGFGDPLT
jgi:hypothetical protein